MSEAKTKPTDVRPEDFLKEVSPQWKQDEAFQLLALFKKITGEEPVMWGPGIIGFGTYHYVYDSGREGDWMLAGFSPRKANLTVYILGGFDNQTDLLERLGKFKQSKGCLYIKKLADIDIDVLSQVVTISIETVKIRYASHN